MCGKCTRLPRGNTAVCTTTQLAGLGVARATLARWSARGVVRRLHHGVYLVGPVAPPLARFAAAQLAVRGGVVSHRSAAILQALRPEEQHAVDISTTARGARSRDGILVHTTAALPESEVRSLDNLRVTSPERTLLDLAAVGDPHLARALEEARIRRLVSDATIRALLDRHRGRRGTAPLAAAVRAPDPSLTRSEAERRLLALIRTSQLPRPQTNVRVGRFEVDLLWPAERLIVEVDGFAFHGTRAAFERDRARDAELQARGYSVVRITWRQIEREPHAVVARLAAALARAAA